ncbi:MAG TPA: AAA family ATPase [Bryobacteraceae bacterium]|nr:AAA family ATPase [Bryobacteraceae bacterium]
MRPYSTALIIGDPQLRTTLRSALAHYPVRIVLEDRQLDFVHLKRLDFDVIFIDAEPVGERIAEVVARISAAKPSALIVAIGDEARPDAVLAALRAGAGEIILPPVDNRLAAVMDRLSATLGKRVTATVAKQVAFVSAKGGCGATTLACHVASCLNSTAPLNVLLLDLDFNAGLSGFLLRAKTQYTVVDAAVNAHRMDASLWKGYVTACKPRLDVLPSPISTVFREDFRPDTLREAMLTANGLYDWVIADLGRGLNPYSAELLGGFDEICLVTTPTASAVYQAGQILARAVERGVARERIRLIVNQTHPTQSMNRGEMERSLALRVFAEIPYRDGIEEGCLEGRLMQPNSAYGRDCSRLAGKLTDELAADEHHKRFWSFLGGRRKAS